MTNLQQPLLCSPCSKKNPAEFAKEDFPEAAEEIKNNAYVDDIVNSYANHETALLRTKQMEDILGRGNFKIKGWRIS